MESPIGMVTMTWTGSGKMGPRTIMFGLSLEKSEVTLSYPLSPLVVPRHPFIKSAKDGIKEFFENM
jgi:hypothetical protein